MGIVQIKNALQLDIMSTRKIVLIAVMSGVAVLLLWFAYYAISPLFRNIKVDEALSASKRVETQTTAEPYAQATPVQVTGTAGHPASGTVRVVDVDGKKYIRYENLKTINGPDLYIYLAKDLDAKEFVSLGTLRATEGNINYEVPLGTNPAEYKYAMTWCKQFGVLFNYADLSEK